MCYISCVRLLRLAPTMFHIFKMSRDNDQVLTQYPTVVTRQWYFENEMQESKLYTLYHQPSCSSSPSCLGAALSDWMPSPSDGTALSSNVLKDLSVRTLAPSLGTSWSVASNRPSRVSVCFCSSLSATSSLSTDVPKSTVTSYEHRELILPSRFPGHQL